MKRVIGYVNTADLNHMREEDVRALTVINIAFGLIRDGEVGGDARMHDGIVSIRKCQTRSSKIALSVRRLGVTAFPSRREQKREESGLLRVHLQL